MLANFSFSVNGTFHKIIPLFQSSGYHFVGNCTKIWEFRRNIAPKSPSCTSIFPRFQGIHARCEPPRPILRGGPLFCAAGRFRRGGRAGQAAISSIGGELPCSSKHRGSWQIMRLFPLKPHSGWTRSRDARQASSTAGSKAFSSSATRCQEGVRLSIPYSIW